MIQVSEALFHLQTLHTSYVFRVLPSGQLEHLYYGRKIRIKNGEGLVCKCAYAPGNTISYSKEFGQVSQENLCLEYSGRGKGDIREPFIEIAYADGSTTCDFAYESYEISQKKALQTLPSSYDAAEKAEQLRIVLRDKRTGVICRLLYSVFEDCDCIVRSAVLENTSEQTVRVERMLSMQLDLPNAGYKITDFHGGWAREMCKNEVVLNAGKYVINSNTGTSSNRANPFFMISDSNADEDNGACLGFNQLYSGNHYEAVEVNSFGKTRVVSGINPDQFSWKLQPGEVFEAPEAVLTYSGNGFNELSGHMHAFVREHIVRGEWKYKERPVLLNSWEAAYFDINERKLVNLAKAAKSVGIELFVMDDGWFGERENDTKSLGDWTVNEKKLPGGLKSIADKITGLGLSFGIWVEPEMVCVDSKLYREHPDWAIQIPGADHSEGRNQRLLDFNRPEVVDYIIDTMTEVFASADISYVKWDMNRIFSDVYSAYLPADRQGQVLHGYMLGLYRCMKTLTERFPQILFEGCSAGGNRFDLGILCYFPQIWASDNTDALCRSLIQNGYSYGYPTSVMTAHVSSCPNHQTLRNTPLSTRYAAACFAALGYECNLCDMGKEELEAIKAQIETYKVWRKVFQFGRFYRGRSFNGMNPLSPASGNVQEWTVVSEDQKKAVGMVMQCFNIPNNPGLCYHAKGLKEDVLYHFGNTPEPVNVKNFGDLINAFAPIHIRQDSLMQDLVAKFYKLPGEKEEYTAYGDELMYAGVKLKQSFAGTGFDENVRYFPDFGARLYYMESAEE